MQADEIDYSDPNELFWESRRLVDVSHANCDAWHMPPLGGMTGGRQGGMDAGGMG